MMWINVTKKYSMLQLKFLRDKKSAKDYGLDIEGHSSCFNPEGLKNLCKAVGLERMGVFGESFIDFNLINLDMEYYENPSVGKNCIR